MPKPFKGFGNPPNPTFDQPTPRRQRSLGLPSYLPKEDVILEESSLFIAAIGLHDAYHLERSAINCHKRFGLGGLLAILGLALTQASKEDLDWFSQQESSVIPKQVFDPEEIDILLKMTRPSLSNK
jgi:hypothetical protein